jgi:SAM-dependent methyltransferase
MSRSELRLVESGEYEDSLSRELALIREKIQKIKIDQKLGSDGSSDRGQVFADSSFERVINYTLKYGLDHALELRDAVTEWKNLIVGVPHLLDLGCGIGLSDMVLRCCGIETSSYAGIDHNPEMLKLALKFNLGSTFTKEIRTVQRNRQDGFLIINHLFGQQELSQENLSEFAYYISRIFTQRVNILNIEPQMSIIEVNRTAFRELLKAVGFNEDLSDLRKTKTQFASPKNSWFGQYTLSEQKKSKF